MEGLAVALMPRWYRDHKRGVGSPLAAYPPGALRVERVAPRGFQLRGPS